MKKEITMKTYAGDLFAHVADEAKKLSGNDTVVNFEFNGIICRVDENTNLEWLYRDYMNADTMGWKIIGTNCKKEYTEEIKAALIDRRRIEEEERAKSQMEFDAKCAKEKEQFEQTVSGIVAEISNMDEWNKGLNAQTSDYGKCIFEYAEGWAKLMQKEMQKGKTVSECAEETSHLLSFFGITGFMYGMAVSVLSQCWKYGEELRAWHNAKYGVSGKGTANPALLKIST
jgi:hypothetical protein